MATPVVLVHGARTSGTMWRAQLAALARAGIPAHPVDLPGHGTRLGERFTLDGALAALDDGVLAVGGRACVVGLSLGGYLAIELRRRRPERVAAVVAAGCCTTPGSPLRRGWAAASRCVDLVPGGGAALNRAMVGLWVDRQGALDLGAGGFAVDAMSDILAEVAGLDPVAALRAPVTPHSPVWLVNGRWDHFRLGERAFVQAAAIGAPGSRLEVIPRARHLVSIDAPVAFNRVLLAAVAAADAARETEPTTPR